MPAFFITGNDENGVKLFASGLAAQLGAGLDEFSFDVIDGATSTADESADRIHETATSLQSYPFFAGKKVVWLKNAAFFSEGAAGKIDAVAAPLDALFAIATALLPESVDFILSAPVPDKRRSQFKRFSVGFQTTVIDLPTFGFNATEQDIVKWVSQQSRAFGINIEHEAAVLLAARVGALPGQLRNEMEKLAIAAQGTAVSERLVASLVPTTRQGNVFEMGHSISKRNAKRGVAVLQRLLEQKESPISILLAGIVPTVRSLFIARDLVDFEGVPSNDSKAAMSAIQRLPKDKTVHLPRKKDGNVNAYGLSLAAVDSANYSSEELARAMVTCADANVAMISGEADPEVEVQKTLVSIVGR